MNIPAGRNIPWSLKCQMKTLTGASGRNANQHRRSVDEKAAHLKLMSCSIRGIESPQCDRVSYLDRVTRSGMHLCADDPVAKCFCASETKSRLPATVGWLLTSCPCKSGGLGMKRKRKRRARPLKRVKLIRHHVLDLNYILPCDVLLPTIGALVTVQAGCELATLIAALRQRE